MRNGSPALTRKTETSIPKLRNHRRAQSDIVASTSAFTTALSTLLTISNIDRPTMVRIASAMSTMDLSPTACNSCDPSKLDVFQSSGCWKTKTAEEGRNGSGRNVGFNIRRKQIRLRRKVGKLLADDQVRQKLARGVGFEPTRPEGHGLSLKRTQGPRVNQALPPPRCSGLGCFAFMR